MLSFGYPIRYHDYAVGPLAGTALLFLPLILTWAQDTGAYAVGRTLGRRKLIPSVSPGKTVEGAVGGILVTVLVCWAYVRWVLVPVAQLGLRPADILLFAIVISVAAQVGDLAESLIKREAGVKDSSRIIPGHGGVLDRFDSLLFVLPVAHLLLGAMLIPAPGGR
jgi:phosphatidate cytidylyltransferase